MFNKIGIIGGTGELGSMFAKYIKNCGIQCLVSDEHCLDVEKQITKQCDLIILSVPIDVSVLVADRIGPYLNTNQTWIDFTSIKNTIVPTMLKYKAEVIPTHPMFSPMADMSNQTIITFPTKYSHNYFKLKQLFTKLALNIVELNNWKDHDELMSYIQGLIHFIHIVFTSVLKFRNIDLDTLMKIASPVYRANFAFACRIISRNPNLYSHILIDNKHNLNIINDFLNKASATLDIIKEKKELELNNIIFNLKDFLGHFTQDFSKESDFLVEQMTNYNKN